MNPYESPAAIAVWEAAEWLDNETDVPDTRAGRHAIQLLRDRALRIEQEQS